MPPTGSTRPLTLISPVIAVSLRTGILNSIEARAQAIVSFPLKRTFYKKALENVLFQARLRSELRVDEAGTPFLWISSTKR